MRVASRESRACLLCISLMLAAAGAHAQEITVVGCPEEIRNALNPPPLDWADNALRVLSHPRDCHRTFTGRYRFRGDEWWVEKQEESTAQLTDAKNRYGSTGARNLSPARLNRMDQVVAEMRGFRIEVECLEGDGVSYRLDPGAPGGGGELLRIRLGSGYTAAWDPSAPQDPTFMAVATALVSAATEGSSSWTDVPALPAAPPLRFEIQNEIRSITALIEEAWSEAHGRGPRPLVIIGRLPDTDLGRECPGHQMLDIPCWTPCRNDLWICERIQLGRTFYVGGRVTEGALCCNDRGTRTVYHRELTLIQEAGYRRWGNYLIPPPGAPPAGDCPQCDPDPKCDG